MHFGEFSCIPQHEHVLLHVRLKSVVRRLPSGFGYKEISLRVLDAVRSRHSKSIVVPTFTYSFTKTLRFSVAQSPSEVGRFSEEVRQSTSPTQRTIDPIFSVIDVDDFGWANGHCHTEAFGKHSLWQRWEESDAIIVNLDLPEVVSTQIHFIERLANVPYRYDKTFSGQVTGAGNGTRNCAYRYYVRDLDLGFKWDRPLIEQTLRSAGVLHESLWEGLPVRWFRAGQLRSVLQPIMESEPNFFLTRRAET